MGNRRIEIVIDKDGTVKIDALNFQGPECAQYLAALQAAVGDLVEQKRKDEFYDIGAGQQDIVGDQN